MNFRQLYAAWIRSYNTNKEHALRDANRNLKGFTANMRDALEKFSADYAFGVAIRKTLSTDQEQVRRKEAAIARRVAARLLGEPCQR